jgi:triosephosphate isomerase
MLKDLGVKYVIIGHSERRKLGETDEIINKKIQQALKNNLKVIFCVGETERDEAGNYLQFVKEEIIKGLGKVSVKLFKNLIIAYEPIWAISSAVRPSKAQYHPDTPEDAFQMATYIKRVLISLFGKPARDISVLYGGSVDETNARDFLEKGNVDGLLVGRTSWNVKNFGELLKNIK